MERADAVTTSCAGSSLAQGVISCSKLGVVDRFRAPIFEAATAWFWVASASRDLRAGVCFLAVWVGSTLVLSRMPGSDTDPRGQFSTGVGRCPGTRIGGSFADYVLGPSGSLELGGEQTDPEGQHAGGHTGRSEPQQHHESIRLGPAGADDGKEEASR